MPLTGIRVVDVSRYAPGPYCTMLMADLGADVVIVEAPPGVGRHVGEEMGVSERNKAFLPMGRNKRSVALDLKDEAMREAFLRLAEGADVVVEGFRPGVATRLGIDYQAVKARNPRIVYCSITGYGQTGPNASLPGHDLNYISQAGILGAIGWPGQPPSIPLNILADFAGGGLFAAFAVLAALVSRQQTGVGQYIDMAMSDGAMSLACLAASDYFVSGTPARPGEYFLSGAYPCYNVYATADDEWLSVACTEPRFWSNLCRVLDCEEYVEDQFNPDKFPDMFAFLRRKFREKTRDEWFRSAQGAGDLRNSGVRPGRGAGGSAQPGTRDDHGAGASRVRKDPPGRRGAEVLGNAGPPAHAGPEAGAAHGGSAAGGRFLDGGDRPPHGAAPAGLGKPGDRAAARIGLLARRDYATCSALPGRTSVMPDDALAGIRVVELSSGVAAPFCAKLFSDYGAEVIKVEPPDGDVSRRWGPFPADDPHPEKSGLFFFLNTNKRGVTLDVDAHASSASSCCDLVAGADVFVENNQPAADARAGASTTRRSPLRNPDLVMISITPFGQTGPYADWKGYGPECLPPLRHRQPLLRSTRRAPPQARHLLRRVLRRLRRRRLGPRRRGGPRARGRRPADRRLLRRGHRGALRRRAEHRRHGPGRRIRDAHRRGNAAGRTRHHPSLQGRPRVDDGPGAGQWNGLCRAMGDPEWAQVEMFQDMFARAQNADVIYPLIEQWTMEHTKQEIMDLCQENGCPTTALFTVAEVAEHPHLAEREFMVRAGAPGAGHVRTLGAPIRLPESPGGPRRPAPLLGQHNRRVSGRSSARSAAGACSSRDAPFRSKASPRGELRLGLAGPGGGADARASRRRGLQDRIPHAHRHQPHAASLRRRSPGPGSQPPEPRGLGRQRQHHAGL